MSLIGGLAGSAAGGSPPTPTAGPGITDEHGILNFGSGTSPTAGALLRVVFGAGWTGGGIIPSNGLAICTQPMNAATVALGVPYLLWDVAGSGRWFDLVYPNAPAASQPVGTYVVGFIVGN